MYHFSFAHGEVVAHMFGVSTVSVLVKGFFVLQKPCHQTQRLSWRLRFPEKKTNWIWKLLFINTWFTWLPDWSHIVIAYGCTECGLVYQCTTCHLPIHLYCYFCRAFCSLAQTLADHQHLGVRCQCLWKESLYCVKTMSAVLDDEVGLAMVKYNDEENGSGQGQGQTHGQGQPHYTDPPDAPAAKGNFQIKCEVKSGNIMVIRNPSRSATQYVIWIMWMNAWHMIWEVVVIRC